MTTSGKASKSSPPRPRACTMPSTPPARPGTGTSRSTGTLIPTTRAHVEGPTKRVDLFWSGRHHRHGVNLEVSSAPDGYPLRVAQARPGREHDSTAAHHTGVEEAIALLNIGVSDDE